MSLSLSLSLYLSLSLSNALYLSRSLPPIASPGHVDVRGMLGAEEKRGRAGGGGGGDGGGRGGGPVLTHPGREVLPETIGSTRRLEHTATGHMVYRYHIHFACGRPWVQTPVCLLLATRTRHCINIF